MIRCYITVRCDKCGTQSAPYSTEHLAREWARTRGWVHWPGKDYCAACFVAVIDK